MTDGRRIGKFARSDLDDEQRALYDAIADGRRASGPQLFRLTDEHGGLEGPFNAFLLQPRLGTALQALGSSVRYETSLPDRAREVAILVVARHWDSAFEWYAHEAVGRHVGLTDEDMEALQTGRYVDLPDPDALVASTTSELVATGDLSTESYERAAAGIGERQLFELTTLVGYYATLALQLRIFRVALPKS